MRDEPPFHLEVIEPRIGVPKLTKPFAVDGTPDPFGQGGVRGSGSDVVGVAFGDLGLENDVVGAQFVVHV